MFEAITKSLIGAPISRAIQPARTLPKLPVGTLNVTGPFAGVASVSAAIDVVHDLGHHPRPVDRVHRRQAVALAERRRR